MSPIKENPNPKPKTKTLISIILMKIALPIFAIILVFVLVTGMIYYMTIDDGSYRQGDETSTPFAVQQFSDNVVIYEDGSIESAITVEELWNQMIENDSRVYEYLDEPAELKKLINAQLITNNLDTRQNPDKKIKWDKINEDIDSKEVQGIIKLKRADNNGNTFLLKYTDPDTFQSYIDKYNETGSASDRANAMKYYTIEKGFVSSNVVGNYNKGTDGQAKKIEAGDVIEIPQGQNYGTTYTYNSWQLIGAGKQLELRNKAGMTFDDEDFGRINGRYVVAVTPKFGSVGDYIDYYYIDKNGNEQIIPCIICDVKGSDAQNEWGHHGGTNVLEFYVNEVTWCTPNWPHPSGYKSCGQASEMHANPGTATCHPEWQGYATKIVNGGSYFDNPDFVEGKVESNTENGSENVPQEGEKTESEENGFDGEIEPLKWPTDPSAPITSPFGPRKSPTAGASSNHQGIDIGVAYKEVYATETGTVVNSEYKDLNGNWIKIDHGNGYESLYLHNDQLLVNVGDVVAKGQVIAISGNTGVGTGPHLHFAIKLKGNYIDPMLFKYDNGKGNGTGGFGSAIDPSAATGASGNGVGGGSYYAKVATWNEVVEKVQSNDPEQETKNNTTYTMTSTKINYQQLVSGYKMPFDYLWALLVISEDKDFVFEIADLVYDSEIEITVHDNISKNTSVMTDTYTKSTKVVTDDIVVNAKYDGNETNIYGGPFEDEKEEHYTTTTTFITTTNTLDIALTKANVWIVNYEQEFERQGPEEVPSPQSPDKHFEDEEYPSEPDKQDSRDAMNLADDFRQEKQNQYEQSYTDVQTEVTSLLSKYYYKTINRVVSTSNTTINTKYISSPAVIEEKTDKDADEPNFVTIFVDYTRARHTILRSE